MKIKGTGARMASNPEDEPDFYHMQPMAATTSLELDSPISQKKQDEVKSETADPVESDQGMPPLDEPIVTSSDDTDYVFDNMPFHMIDAIHESRRHSLMAIHRRNSLALARELTRRNSLLTPGTGVDTFLQPQPDDDAFFNEMDMLSSLGNSSLTDQEMVNILDKIIK